MNNVMALCWAGAQGDINEVKKLVANGVNLNEADYDGRTCGHLAASEGHLEVVNFLIKKGVDFKLKDRWGYTPLDDSIRHGHPKIVELIKNYNEQKK